MSLLRMIRCYIVSVATVNLVVDEAIWHHGTGVARDLAGSEAPEGPVVFLDEPARGKLHSPRSPHRCFQFDRRGQWRIMSVSVPTLCPEPDPGRFARPLILIAAAGLAAR